MKKMAITVKGGDKSQYEAIFGPANFSTKLAKICNITIEKAAKILIKAEIQQLIFIIEHFS